MAQQFNAIMFDPVTREIVLSSPLFSPTVDMVTTSNPSVQNGFIILTGKCFNLSYPLFGVGIGGALGSPGSVLANGLNQWKTQVNNDGATYANTKIAPGTKAFQCFINYLPNGDIQIFGGG